MGWSSEQRRDAPQLESEPGAVDERQRSGRDGIWNRLYGVPWWALALIAIGIWVGFSIAADEIYSRIFTQLRAGIEMTLRISTISYSLALVFGLIVGVIRSTPPRPKKGLIAGTLSFVRLLLYNAATLYVEVMRGLPVLIVLLISAFVIVPGVREILLEAYGIQLPFRGASVETAIIGLSLTYGAFLSEIFRAGIQSIEKGQIEAARSLGMNYFQVMWLVVLPQAIRRVLPPLGNDFISMIKDSSLVAILGIRDVTQIARVTSGSSFRYLETYLTVAVIYLTMTILGSMLVRLLERRSRQHQR
jgi:polar amino acid transport system permease protein